MEKKYKLTEETINIYDRTLYRIEALMDFSDVKKGDKGGFIENENNLSHNGNCWVYDNAMVFGYAVIYGNAMVFGHAKVFGYAKVYGNVMVFGHAKVYGNANVFGRAEVGGDAKVYGNATVYGTAEVFDNANIYGDANVFDKAKVYGYAGICGDATITSDSDYIIFKNWWSSGRFFTWTRSNNMWKVGCFYGTGKELIEKAHKDSEISGREYKRVVDYVESILNNN